MKKKRNGAKGRERTCERRCLITRIPIRVCSRSLSYARVSVYACSHTHTHTTSKRETVMAYAAALTNEHTHTQTYVCVCVYVCMYVCMHVPASAHNASSGGKQRAHVISSILIATSYN